MFLFIDALKYKRTLDPAPLLPHLFTPSRATANTGKQWTGNVRSTQIAWSNGP